MSDIAGPTDRRHGELRALIAEARQRTAVAVNTELTRLYWLVGKRLHDEILGGERAACGQRIIASLGVRLAAEFGRGFEAKNLRRMVQFSECFPDAQIVASLMRQLSWTHFLRLVPIDLEMHRDGIVVAEYWTELPPRKELEHRLHQADALRAKRRAALAQLDTLTQSIFLEMFGDPATNPKGWPLVTITDVAEQVTDGEHITPKRTTEGVKLLSARNVRDGHIDFENVDYIGSREYERIRRRCEPSLGDVLISCSGTIGRVASVETNEAFALVRSAALVRPRRSAVGYKFLEHYLRTPALKARMIRRANASSQDNLFQGQIRQLPVYLPPLSLQHELARRVAAVEKVKSTHRASLSELDALFASLQHRAFRGELWS